MGKSTIDFPQGQSSWRIGNRSTLSREGVASAMHSLINECIAFISIYMC